MAVAENWYPDITPSAQRLDKLMAILPVGVVVLDGNGRVRDANSMAVSLLGEPLHDQPWVRVVERAFRPQADDGAEVSLVNGRRVKLDICPLDGEPGQLIVISDLTETRSMQTRMAHMQRLSSLGRMVASLAHQIRTPLSAAMLYAGQLDHQLPQQTHQRFSEKLMSRLKDLESQMNNMLLFAKSGEQKVADTLTVSDILSELNSAVESMLESHQARLTISGDGQHCQILGAQQALVSALSNLVHNALQAGARHLSLQVRQQHEQLQLQLDDDGSGIAEEVLAQVTDPFFTTKSHGTGLGLSVVRAVVHAHGGRLTVTNGEQGARICLLLPLLKEAV